MNEKTWEEKLESIFSGINNTTDLSEQFLLDIVAKSATWLSPMVPAILIHASVTQHLEAIPDWGAFLLAYVIEALGITTVTNTMVQWEICQRDGNSDNWRMFWVALGTATFYVLINVLLVIFLKVYPDTLATWAMGLMTLLSVVAGVGTVMRVRQAKEAMEDRKQRRIAEHEKERERMLKYEDEQRKRDERAEERRLKRLSKYGVQSGVQSTVQLNSATLDEQRPERANEQSVEQRREQLLSILGEHGDLGATEFARRLNVKSRNTIYSDLKALADSQLAHKNGNGWEVGSDPKKQVSI